MYDDEQEIQYQSESFEELYKNFDEELIVERCDYLSSQMISYLESRERLDDVTIHKPLLINAVLDYFVDIDMIKNFHKIELVNNSKIAAYTSYWLLRRKPLQVIRDTKEQSLCFINEKFVFYFLVNFILGDSPRSTISKKATLHFDNFTNTLYYYLKYRRIDPQTLELMILSFISGRTFDQ